MDENNKKENFLQRIAKAVQYTVTGVKPNTWMGPGQPIQPVAQEAEGRLTSYPISSNLTITPKTNEGITFPQLRALAENCDLVSLCIQTRKDQMARMKWKIQLKNAEKGVVKDKRCEEVEKILEYPDGEHDHDTWMGMVLDDLLVIDAPTLYPFYNNGGKIMGFDIIDGATIKRIIDDTGRTPRDGVSPAYQQKLNGLPAVNYTYEELVYKPRNLRSYKLYGYSPVEQVVHTVNLYLRKVTNQLDYYKDGNTPNLLFSTPESWTPDHIKQFQKFWDELNMGGNKHHAKFIPSGVEPFDTKPVELKNEFDEWLARIIFFAFSISPSALVKDSNKATAQVTADNAESEGLHPLLEWYKNLMNFLIQKYFGYEDVEFIWDTEPETDPLIKAQIDTMYVNAGVLDANEVRATLGYDPKKEEPEPKPKAEAESDDEEDATKSFKKKISVDTDEEPESDEDILIALILAYLLAQQQAIVSQFPKNSSSITVNPDYSLMLGMEMAKKLLKSLTPTYERIAEEKVVKAMKDVKLATPELIEEAKAQAKKYATRRSAELIGKKILKDGSIIDNPKAEMCINDTTRTEIEDLVGKAMNEGWSNQELRDKLMDNYNFSKDRAMMIARTETNLASNNIALDTYKTAGVKKKKWLTAQDDRVEIHCIENEQQGAIPIGDVFKHGGLAPPAHPNCRCTILAHFD